MNRHRPIRYALCGLLLVFMAIPGVQAASKIELDTGAQATLERLYEARSEARVLAGKASGLLIFPRIIKGGVGVGGEYGEGVLQVAGIPDRYYRVTSLSFGFQLGGQAKSEVIMFMTPEALRDFVQSNGWEAGIDGSIAVIQFGVGRELDTNSVREPIIAFLFDNKGLMYNLSLEGSKFWQIDK